MFLHGNTQLEGENNMCVRADTGRGVSPDEPSRVSFGAVLYPDISGRRYGHFHDAEGRILGPRIYTYQDACQFLRSPETLVLYGEEIVEDLISTIIDIHDIEIFVGQKEFKFAVN
jgi:hypothetical protein